MKYKTTPYRKHLALLFQVHQDTIRNKVLNDSWSVSELAMVKGDPLVIPDDFYKQFHIAMYQKEITKVSLAKDMGLCYDSMSIKVIDESFRPSELYYLTKNVLDYERIRFI